MRLIRTVPVVTQLLAPVFVMGLLGALDHSIRYALPDLDPLPLVRLQSGDGPTKCFVFGMYACSRPVNAW